MNELAVINDGLVRLGAAPVSSLDEASAQAIGAGNIYPRERATALAEFPWSFAVKQTELSKLSTPKDERDWHGFEYVYQLPSDGLRVLGLESLDSYYITGSRLHTDDKEARAVYISNVEESYWPHWFARVVSLRFAAAVAIMITDASTRAELMYQEARRAMQTARLMDSQQVPRRVWDLMSIYTRNRNFMAGA